MPRAGLGPEPLSIATAPRQSVGSAISGRYGCWTVHRPYGRTGDGGRVNGRRDGRWTWHCPDGSRIFSAYREGLLGSVWAMNDANGATVERERWKDGRWMGKAGLCAE